MVKRLDINKPLKVKGIYIKGNSKPLHDRICFIAGNFLIVAKDENDTAPTWYNVDQVNKLEGVEQIPEQRSAQQIRFFT